MSIGRTPTVFVSSTCYDLKQIREDIRDFFRNNYNFEVMLSEFDSFPVDPCKGTFENCLNNVDNSAEIFILIIGTRYGYVTDQGKSITNLEYLHAKAKGIPIYVFVSKQLNNSLPLWRNNKNGDFSSVVDNPKIFEFVSEIYDEMHQWVYTYDSVSDIKATLKNQLLGIFADGLKFIKLKTKPQYSVLNCGIPSDAARVLIEQPYAWEYKFLAYVLKNDFDNLKSQRWNYRYGLVDGPSLSIESIGFADEIISRINEIKSLVNNMGIIIKKVIDDALGKPGVPSDLEMILYASKQLASKYERLISWALYFKALHTDERYSHLLELLYELPTSALNSIDDFVNRIYNEMTSIPDEDDGKERRIALTCTLNVDNQDELIAEINRLTVSVRKGIN